LFHNHTPLLYCLSLLQVFSFSSFIFSSFFLHENDTYLFIFLSFFMRMTHMSFQNHTLLLHYVSLLQCVTLIIKNNGLCSFKNNFLGSNSKSKHLGIKINNLWYKNYQKMRYRSNQYHQML
jgi:hypothetical protein